MPPLPLLLLRTRKCTTSCVCLTTPRQLRLRLSNRGRVITIIRRGTCRQRQLPRLPSLRITSPPRQVARARRRRTRAPPISANTTCSALPSTTCNHIIIIIITCQWAAIIIIIITASTACMSIAKRVSCLLWFSLFFFNLLFLWHFGCQASTLVLCGVFTFLSRRGELEQDSSEGIDLSVERK